MFPRVFSIAAGAALGASLLATTALAGATGFGSDRGSTGFDEATRSVGPVHVMRTRSSGPAQVRHDLTGQLPYNGGLVELVPKVYLIFWGFKKYGDPTGEKPYLVNFMNGVGGSTWLKTVTQYYDMTGTMQNPITNPSGQLGGTWAYAGAVPTQPTDAQVQAVAQRGVKHFGFNPNATYFVMTPTGHNSSGFGSQYCAYHGAFRNQAGKTVAYTNLPYITDAGYNCGENFINAGPAGVNDGVSVVGGHEQAEAITDPNPPTGWSGNQGEIGDLCAWASNSTDVTLSTGSFAVQPLWSDVANACVTAS